VIAVLLLLAFTQAAYDWTQVERII
jgi:hypothetical protein